ncbi:predicted protein [Coccidioides posadasii str. Silveira]|uniref:Predicted protein n=1 Tax=Coccidioides posadasii (strain RMSCC 757 / Silveira) TaxID=443226 RepID=E9CUF6_COCPS|nr:predicted protein [Coccidioides posadasii str. Silveira]
MAILPGNNPNLLATRLACWTAYTGQLKRSYKHPGLSTTSLKGSHTGDIWLICALTIPSQEVRMNVDTDESEMVLTSVRDRWGYFVFRWGFSRIFLLFAMELCLGSFASCGNRPPYELFCTGMWIRDSTSHSREVSFFPPRSTKKQHSNFTKHMIPIDCAEYRRDPRRAIATGDAFAEYFIQNHSHWSSNSPTTLWLPRLEDWRLPARHQAPHFQKSPLQALVGYIGNRAIYD